MQINRLKGVTKHKSTDKRNRSTGHELDQHTKSHFSKSKARSKVCSLQIQVWINRSKI